MATKDEGTSCIKRSVIRSFLPLVFAGILLSSCTSVHLREDSPRDAADRAEAEANLQRLVAAKQAREEQARRLEEQRLAAEAARAAEAAKPHYPPALLESAARPRVWGPANIDGMGIECHLNSNWIDGHINYRVALLGPRMALEQFMLHHKFFVNFQDQPGTNLFAYEISPSDFEWDPPNANGGCPTMETRGEVPCDLYAYQQAVQWNITFVD